MIFKGKHPQANKLELQYKQLINYTVENVTKPFTTVAEAKAEAHRLTAQGEVLGHATVFMIDSTGERRMIIRMGGQHAL